MVSPGPVRRRRGQLIIRRLILDHSPKYLANIAVLTIAMKWMQDCVVVAAIDPCFKGGAVLFL